MDPSGRERYLVDRLRRLRTACIVLAATVLLYAIVGWFLIEGFQLRPFGKVPEALPLSMTFFAAVLILLASRLRSGILRGGLPSIRGIPTDLGNLVSAYQRATLVSFAILEFAALIGLLVALLSGSSFYGVVLCVASFLSMLLRWPNAREVDRLARGRLSP